MRSSLFGSLRGTPTQRVRRAAHLADAEDMRREEGRSGGDEVVHLRDMHGRSVVRLVACVSVSVTAGVPRSVRQ